MSEAGEAFPRDGEHETAEPLRVAQTASARLRAAREAAGMSTAQIAARTRITQRHVEALDRGDLGALPGKPYVLGFVRAYARAVGLDETELARMARSEVEAAAPRPEPRVVHQFDVDDPAKTPSRALTWFAVIAVMALVLAGTLVWRSYYLPDAALPGLALPDPAPAPAAAPPPKPAPQPAAQPNGPVVFTAEDDAIWVKFYDASGKQLLQKQLARGESYTVPADAVGPKLWTGRPDALAITIGGQLVPHIAERRMIVRDVPVTAAALLARPATPSAAASAPAPERAAPVARGPHRRVNRVIDDAATAAPAPAESAAPVPQR